MAMTVNNTNTLSLLTILNRTTATQDNIVQRMSTGKKINRGADDPAGLLAVTKLNSELTAVDAAISNNQRTDAMLSVADNALGEISNLISEIQRLANETANSAALTADEIAANQAQIDDALTSIDRIVQSTNFNGKNLIDGSLGINATVAAATKVTDVHVYSRTPGSDDVTLTVRLRSAAEYAVLSNVVTATTSSSRIFTVQGLLGTAVISVASNEAVSSIAAKVNAAAAQTGVSAVYQTNGSSITRFHLYSRALGSKAFVRTRLLEGSGVTQGSDIGVDAVVTVNGQQAAVDGNHVTYTGNGVSLAFENAMTTAADSTTITIKGEGAGGSSGATFSLGTDSGSMATIGIDGLYTSQLGNRSVGYLKSLASGGTNSLLNNPTQAAEIAREAAKQVATLRGRIGGFQKFQVRTAINSLNDNKEGLEKVRSAINDVDYAVESAALNRQNVLLQSAISLLGLANQQSAQVLALLR